MSINYRNRALPIGNTPLVRLFNIEKKHALNARLFAKLEMKNLSGSVKDRAALSILLGAEREGGLKRDCRVVEATSGNMGISLAMLCAIGDFRSVIVMPRSSSEERRKVMRAYGSEVILTDGNMSSAVYLAREISRESNIFYVDQFNNHRNADAHFLCTGREIFRDTKGSVDIFICGIGSSGSLSGVSRFLKRQKPSVRVVGIEPSESPFISQGRSGEHRIFGIGAGFTPPLFTSSLCDEVATVDSEDAIFHTALLAKSEGILAGISSGAALSVGIKEAGKQENKDKTIVLLFPDGGERYLSLDLF